MTLVFLCEVPQTVTWNLDDKALALSLFHDNELTAAERAAVENRLATDVSWREAYAQLQKTEKQLAAAMQAHAADPRVAAVELTMKRYLDAHRLDENAFPAAVVKQAYPNRIERWLETVLRAHRVDEKFVQQVLDARRIESFQEPLDAQLKEAIRAHRVGTAFIEKVVGEAQGKSQPVADVPVVPAVAVTAAVASVALAAPATTAAVPSTPGRGTPLRRRTPTRSLTPARGNATRAGSSRRTVELIAPSRSIWRWLPVAGAAAVLLVVVSLYLFHSPNSGGMTPPPRIAGMLTGTVYTRQAVLPGVAQPAVGGLTGYTAVAELDAEHRAVNSGAVAGQLVALYDPADRTLLARIVLDANTAVRLYGPGEALEGAGILPRGGVVLEQGGLLADVEKGGRTFQILTPGLPNQGYDRIVVQGTRFFVHVAAQKSSVDVLEGEVRIQIPLMEAEQQQEYFRAPEVLLVSGGRYTRSLSDGRVQLQRTDPSEIFYAFAPKQLAVSAWSQSGGGLERGNMVSPAFFDSFQPAELLQGSGTGLEPVLSAPTVLADGRLLVAAGSATGADLVLLQPNGPGSVAARTVRSLGGALRFGPVVLPRGVAATVVGQQLRGSVYDADNAAQDWKVTLPADVDLYALSAGPQGTAILSTSRGLLAYDGATGALVWENREMGEILSGIAATERAEQPFVVAYDSLQGRLHQRDRAGKLKTIELRGGSYPGGGLARDIKNWTLAGTPILAGDNCILVFEDGATALVNLTTGARRMTAGFGATERVRLVTLDRRPLELTVLMQSGRAYRLTLNADGAPQPIQLPTTDVRALAVQGETAWTLNGAGQLQRWMRR